MTQCELIDKYIRDFGEISVLDAVKDLGIMNFTARISNMRQNSKYPKLSDRWEHGTSRYGKKVKWKVYYYGNTD